MQFSVKYEFNSVCALVFNLLLANTCTAHENICIIFNVTLCSILLYASETLWKLYNSVSGMVAK